MSAVKGGSTVGVHNAEIVGVRRIHGALPPSDGSRRAIMTILNLRISGDIIGVLLLIVLFGSVCIFSCAKNLKFGKQIQFVLRRSNIGCGCATAASIIRLKRSRFQDGL